MWKTLDTRLPVPLYSPQAVAHDGYLYVVTGGTATNGGVQDAILAAAISPDDGTLGPFVEVGQIQPYIFGQPTGFISAGVVLDGDLLFVVGGSFGGTPYSRQVQVFRLNAGSRALFLGAYRIPDQDATWVGWGGAGCAVHDGRLFLVGNSPPQNDTGRLIRSAPYNRATGAIGRFESCGEGSNPSVDAPQQLYANAAVVCHGALFSLGGPVNFPGPVSGAFEGQYAKIAPGGQMGILRYLPLVANQARMNAGAVVVDDQIYLVGGWGWPNNDSLNHFIELGNTEILRVSPQGEPLGWTRGPDLNAARDTHALATDGKFIWALGGEDVAFNVLDTIEVLKVK